MQEQALSANDLWQRVNAFKEGGADELILGAATLVGATEILLKTFRDFRGWSSELSDSDFQNLRAVMALHGARFKALSGEKERMEMDAVVALLAVVQISRPEAVPDGIRSAVSKHAQRHLGAGLLVAAALSVHAKILSQLFQATGNRPALDAAISTRRRAVEFAPPTHPYRAAYLSNLSGALQTRFQQTGTLADLKEGKEAAKQALVEALPDNRSYATILSTAGTAFAISFQQAGDITDLEEAINAFRCAAKSLPLEHGGRGPFLSNLSGALGLRFERLGVLSDLEEAIEAAQTALSGMSQDHPQYRTCQNILASALGTRSIRTGEEADLNEAIELAREIVDHVPVAHPELADTLSLLGALLEIRSRRTMVAADADAAVAALERAVAVVASSDPGRQEHLSRLGVAYLQRSKLQARAVRKRADMNAAVGYLRRAVQGTSQGHPLRAVRISNLAGALQDRFELTAAVDDLEEAADLRQEAVRMTPHDNPDHVEMLSNLGSTLGIRARHTQSQADLAAAQEAITGALRARGSNEPGRALDEFNLAMALHDRFKQAADRTQGLTAVELFGRAARSRTLPATNRILAARMGGALAGELGDWDTALTEYERAVELLAIASWHGLKREDRIFGLSQAPGLASDAAAAALQAGRPDRAVILLEHARGVLLSQVLDTRTDRAAVRERDPSLADRMDALRIKLDRPEIMPSAMNPASGPSGEWRAQIWVSEQSERRQVLSREWDDLVAQARALPGMEEFLRPPSFDWLSRAADEGPVLIANASRHRCDVLVISRNGLRVVPLGVGVEVVVDKALELMQALSQAYSSRTHLMNADSVLTETLAWLWDNIVSPVINKADLANIRSQGESWPRLWWCPTGAMSFLPLHAAGHYPLATESSAEQDSVLNYAACSYTSTLRALIDARERSNSTSAHPGGVLTFALPETPGQIDLPQVKSEIRMLRERFPGMTTRIGHEATRLELLRQLPRHEVLHFTGHGGQDPLDPASGVLCTYDETTTISDLVGLQVTSARLAFLSACQTALGAIGIPDESIHLAGAMQLAGFPHVIATRWSISDTIAPEVAAYVYDNLSTDGNCARSGIDPRQAGDALNQAVRLLSSRYRPIFWAPFVHTGA